MYAQVTREVAVLAGHLDAVYPSGARDDSDCLSDRGDIGVALARISAENACHRDSVSFQSPPNLLYLRSGAPVFRRNGHLAIVESQLSHLADSGDRVSAADDNANGPALNSHSDPFQLTLCSCSIRSSPNRLRSMSWAPASNSTGRRSRCSSGSVLASTFMMR